MINRLRPDAYFPSLDQVPVCVFQQRGIRLVLLDVDNTLSSAGSVCADKYAVRQIARLREADIQCVLLSNALPQRIRSYAKSAQIDFIVNPKKPFGNSIKRIMQRYPDYRKDELAIVGDQLFTDVLTGKRAGIFTVLVDPISHDESFHTAVKRYLEKPLKRLLKIRYYA